MQRTIHTLVVRGHNGLFIYFAVALELMDQGVTMWQPTPRKSSCSSCSQNGSSDGSLPNGCNQERQVFIKRIHDPDDDCRGNE